MPPMILIMVSLIMPIMMPGIVRHVPIIMMMTPPPMMMSPTQLQAR